jgi:hypothetical protein
MNLYIKNPTIGGIGLKPGDEIGVFDGNLCVGVGVVEDPDLGYLAVKGSLDDPTTMEIDGFIEGHPFEFRAWENQAGLERETKTINPQEGYTRYFEKNGTSVLTADFDKVTDTYLEDAFPNPSYNKTTFTFQLFRKCKVRLEIFNSLGELVKVLVDNELAEGIHKLEWDNRTSAGYKTGSGVYYYRLRSDGFSKTKSLVIH